MMGFLRVWNKLGGELEFKDVIVSLASQAGERDSISWGRNLLNSLEVCSVTKELQRALRTLNK